MRSSSLRSIAMCLALVPSVTALACSGVYPEDEAYEVENESVNSSEEGVAGPMPVGSVLAATGYLNFRSGPSKGYAVIGVLGKGEQVTVVRSDPSQSYYQIERDGTVGWSHGGYLKVVSTPDTGSTGVAGSTPIGTTLETSTNLYFRTGPGKSYKPIDILVRGTRVTTVNRTQAVNDYFEIEYEGTVGWSHGGYMAVVSTPDESDVECKGIDDAPLFAPTVCDGPGGNTTREIPSNGVYATSWFGCYRKSDGSIYEDPYDNCEFACGPRGYCPSGQSGPACEADLKWFAAGADRYGCGGLIRVTNCDNGRSVVLVTLDRGPKCNSVERACDAPVLDMSRPAMDHLFEGATYGGCDQKKVVVEVMPEGTELGPM